MLAPELSPPQCAPKHQRFLFADCVTEKQNCVILMQKWTLNHLAEDADDGSLGVPPDQGHERTLNHRDLSAVFALF